MKNISSIIKQHTSTGLPKATAQKRERNCKNKDTFHLDSKVFKSVCFRIQKCIQKTTLKHAIVLTRTNLDFVTITIQCSF